MDQEHIQSPQYLPTMPIQPSNRQFLADEGLWMLLTVAAFFAITTAGTFVMRTVCMVVFLGLMFYLLCCYLRFARIKYIITPEQLIFLHGMFYQMTDYMELYRVVDYQQHRSLLQQILGLKTVVIFSGDMSMPCLAIVGLPADSDIIGEIRCRVELNKRERRIYEITNKY